MPKTAKFITGFTPTKENEKTELTLFFDFNRVPICFSVITFKDKTKAKRLGFSVVARSVPSRQKMRKVKVPLVLAEYAYDLREYLRVLEAAEFRLATAQFLVRQELCQGKQMALLVIDSVFGK